VFLENRSAARGYYAQTLEVAGRIGFRPELALAHVGLAELLVEDACRAVSDVVCIKSGTSPSRGNGSTGAELDFGPFPTLPNGKGQATGLLGGMMGFAVSQKTKARDASVELLRFLAATLRDVALSKSL
jgi:ABC-type glycerol-3-phosphate transport system substrate-binding protein